MKRKKLGEILVEKGFCSKDDVEKALEIQSSYGGRIGTILLNMGAITEEQLLKALSEQLEIDYYRSIDNIDILKININPDILKENNVYPYREDGKYLYVLTNDPLKVEVFSLLENYTGKQVKVSLTKEENLKQLAVMLNLDEIETEKEFLDIDEEVEKLKELASEAPVIKLVNSLLTKAVEQNATDIHFEALKNIMKVRFRIDAI